MTELLAFNAKSLFLSDLHLGHRQCHADVLLNLLENARVEQIYLLGDVIDFLGMHKKSYWQRAHALVIKSLFRRARAGVKITLVPGNHDAVLRQFRGWESKNIHIAHEACYTSIRGDRYWLLHGDRFDHTCSVKPWLSVVGDKLNDVLVDVQYALNHHAVRNAGTVNFSRWIKTSIPAAKKFIETFETTVSLEAKRRGYKGVICGHIHFPQNIMGEGVHYLNTGDWVENCSAVIETYDGNFALYRQLHTTVGLPVTPSYLPHWGAVA